LGFGTGICRVAESSPRKIRGERASCGIAVVGDSVAGPVGIRVVASADGGGVPPTRTRVVGAADGGCAPVGMRVVASADGD
jgi:hypothetical protein